MCQGLHQTAEPALLRGTSEAGCFQAVQNQLKAHILLHLLLSCCCVRAWHRGRLLAF
jgi:hypothetical protein